MIVVVIILVLVTLKVVLLNQMLQSIKALDFIQPLLSDVGFIAGSKQFGVALERCGVSMFD